MPNNHLAEQAAWDLRLLREKRPLIHNITNFVVMNSTANTLLACGASPVMAHAPEEVAEMVTLAGALVLNIGTLTPYWVDAMLLAGRRANERGIPIVLDPVGSGATTLRTRSARRLLDALEIAVVRGNASEVLSLRRGDSGTRGVDSIHSVDDAAEIAAELSTELQTVLAITGKVDLVTDGARTARITNGHELMGFVTGTGCAASALVGAFLAVDERALEAAAFALACFGYAGEQAAERATAPGSFQVSLLDALYTMGETDLASGARIEAPWHR